VPAKRKSTSSASKPVKARSRARAKASAKAPRPAKARKPKAASGKRAAKPTKRRRRQPAIGAPDLIEAKQRSYVLVERDDTANPLLAKGSLVAVRPEEIQSAPWSTRAETPFAERAAGAGQCVQCDTSIARSSWQVVVSDDGATIHPGCAFAWTQDHLADNNETSEWMATLVDTLSDSDRAELLEKLTPSD
jgi:hypothetical protein